MQIAIGKKSDHLSRNMADEFNEGKAKITKKRFNRLNDGVDKRIRQMHATDIAQGIIGPKIMTENIACLRECRNRRASKGAPLACRNEKCKWFSRYEPK